MIIPPVTSTAAVLLALLYIVLTARVILARGASKVSLGDGGGGTIAVGQEHTVPLLTASRSHANFAEYVPLCLILLALTELGGTARWIVDVLAAMLVIGRVLHPLGMAKAIPNPYRAGGLVLTVLTLLGTSVAIVVNLLRSA